MRDEDFLDTKDEHLEKTCTALRELGITYFSYGLIFHEDVLTSFFSNKEWENHYKDKNYNRTDPLLLGVMHSNFSLIIWDALHPVGKEKKVMMERNEMCHIKSGMTFGIKGTRSKEIIALGSPVSPKEFYSLFGEEKLISEVHSIITNFYIPMRNACVGQLTRKLC